jgi:hypothetical protein
LNKSDSFVPLILSYPGGNKTAIETILDSPEVCPGLHCGGNWDVSDIIKAIVESQYLSN